MNIRLHRGDLPDNFRSTDSVAIDTETLGLNPHRDRLCLVQISTGDGDADLVQIAKGQTEAPNLVRLLADPDVTKIFHFARFDLAILQKTFGLRATPVYCTKIASKLTRTYTDRHGLKDLVARIARRGHFQAAAVLRLGRGRPDRSATRLCGLGRAASACPAAKARRHAGARGTRPTGPRMLRLFACPRRTRFGGLARNGYFRPYVTPDTIWSQRDLMRSAATKGRLHGTRPLSGEGEFMQNDTPAAFARPATIMRRFRAKTLRAKTLRGRRAAPAPSPRPPAIARASDGCGGWFWAGRR